MTPPTLLIQSDVERDIARVLRERAIAEMNKSDLNSIAQRLGVSEFAVDSLRARSEWSMEEAMRVAVALGLVPSDMPEMVARNLQ